MKRCFLGFNGERQDPVSGATHLGNGYRAYNPVLMRFNCPDNLSPFGHGGCNTYAYCAGDPVNESDPSGHVSWQGITGIVLGAIGLALIPFTLGQSTAATISVMTGLEAISGVTAIASGTLEDINPKSSSVLNWVSFATGILSLSVGIAPQLGSLVGKGDLVLGSWLKAKLPFLGKIERRGSRVGVPMSGEFMNPRLLGINHTAEGITWNLGYIDRLGNDLRWNAVMASEWHGTQLRARSEIYINGGWELQTFSPVNVRDMLPSEMPIRQFRLIIPNSAGFVNRDISTFAARVSQRLNSAQRRVRYGIGEHIPVLGYRGIPESQGPIVQELTAFSRGLHTLENAGYTYNDRTLQLALDGLAVRFSEFEGALEFSGETLQYPSRLLN